jgi:hypothetical protein
VAQIDELKKLFAKAKAGRSKVEYDWYMNLAYYMGDQWIFWNNGRIDRPKLEPWRVQFVDNRILPIVVSRVARKTKNRVTFQATPGGADESDISATEVTQKILENDWKQLDLDYKHMMVEFWTEICGAGFWKIYWDSTKGDNAEFLYGPQGAIKKNGSPLRYDEAQDDGSYDGYKEQLGDQLEVKNVAIGDIQVDVISPFEIFPDPLANSIDECEWIIEEKVRSEEYVKRVYGLKDVKADAEAPIGIVESRQFNSGSLGKEQYKGVKVYEYFCRPNTTHPNGKWCVWINDQVVRDKDGPESPYAEFPHVMFSSNIVPGRFWPTAVTTQLRPPQTDLNKLQSQIRENAIRIGNPAVLKSRQANVTWTGVPGEEVLFDDTFTNPIPQFLEPPEIPVYVREEIDRIQNSIVEISGLHEVSQGQVPSGITAASAINLLQEADDTRLGPEIQMMENSIAKAGFKDIQLRAKFMDDERTVRLAGEDGSWDIFSYKKAILEKVVNVDVQAGSGMPRSKAAKQAAMMELQINREHRIMLGGTAIMINDYDDDDLHIAGHEELMKSARFERQDDQVKQIILAHWGTHKERRMKAIEKQLEEQQKMMGQGNAPQ